MSRRAWGLLLVLCAVGQVALVHLTAPALFTGVDFVRLHLLNRGYLWSALLAGRLPLWNPHVGLGRPFLADIEVGAFYPPNLIGLPLGGAGGLALSAVLHALLALAGMAGLARHLGMSRGLSAALGLAFLTAAPVAGRLQAGQAPYAHATCYLPLLFLLAARLQERRSPARIAHLALALGLQVLCGHPQIAWISWTGLASFLVGRGLGRPLSSTAGRVAFDLAALALSLAGGLGLAAVQLLPFADLVRQGNRSDPTLEFAAAGAMAPSSWVSLLVPIDAARPFSWETNLYSGLVVALAGAVGLAQWADRDRRGLAAAAVAGALVASGPLTPAFRVLYLALPGLAYFHMPSRSAVLVWFALVVGAGLYLSAPSRRPWALAAATAAALAASAAWTGLPRPTIVVVAALLLAWPYRARWGPTAARGIPALLLIVTVLDIAWATARLKRAYFVGLELSRGERAVELALRRAGLFRPSGAPPRVSVPFWVMRDNSGMARGYSTYSGYVALSLDRVWTYIHAALGLTPSHAANTFPAPDIFRRGPFPFRSMALDLGFDTVTGALVSNPVPDPRAYVVHAVTRVADWREAIRRLAEGHDPHRSILLEPEAAAAPAADGAGAAGRAEIVKFEPETVVVDVETARPGWLVLAEAWYPGWRAWVDGAPAACVPANAWMRGVPVPAGRSQVALRFRSRLLPAGAALTLVSAALLAWAARRG
jgi:hypothetical protein